MTIAICETYDADLTSVSDVVQQAFKHDDEAILVKELLKDETARPYLSLLALHQDKAVGHILFTHATLTESRHRPSMSILAPMAVVPAYQKQGIGARLIQKGCDILKTRHVQFVFVLGHPEYYKQHGFFPAIRAGLHPPYPIKEEHADAWMVKELSAVKGESYEGKIQCSRTLNQPELWT